MSTGGAKSPTGIKIVAVVEAIFGLLISFVVVGYLFLPSFRNLPARVAGYMNVFIAVVAIFGVIYFLIAYGLWKMRSWSWKLAVGFHAVGVVLAILAGNVVTLTISGAIAVYVYSKRDSFP
ncbi:MAG: hypothetical protein SV760_03425 [Halobacteria archaeon]|nr:hypothetical protein [Halobacteria archaeon]